MTRVACPYTKQSVELDDAIRVGAHYVCESHHGAFLVDADTLLPRRLETLPDGERMSVTEAAAHSAATAALLDACAVAVEEAALPTDKDAAAFAAFSSKHGRIVVESAALIASEEYAPATIAAAWSKLGRKPLQDTLGTHYPEDAPAIELAERDSQSRRPYPTRRHPTRPIRSKLAHHRSIRAKYEHADRVPRAVLEAQLDAMKPAELTALAARLAAGTAADLSKVSADAIKRAALVALAVH